MIAQRISEIEQQQAQNVDVTKSAAIKVTVNISTELKNKQPENGILFVLQKR